MVSARILSSIFERSHLIVRNVLFHRDIPPYLKHSAWFYTRTSVNRNIQPNKQYKKTKDQKNEKTEETEKNNKLNWSNRLDGVIYITIVISCVVFSTIIFTAKSMKKKHSMYISTLLHCRKDSMIVDVLGEPIEIVPQKNNVAHTHDRHKKDGWCYEKFTFDIAGPKTRALVEAELKQITDNEYKYTKLHVTVPKVGTFEMKPDSVYLKEDYSKYLRIQV
ncbi:uncharacterized protein LOC116853334 [Odontomachus brunneus]|uniref:uncharacterized protein LOC116853334 n=1 Tax=Odontomachus brunneus TaxID=486640 RepID=UPI0013F22117|nr:uncharacterized protein LOC116853334 [Odontomachus brunneus]